MLGYDHESLNHGARQYVSANDITTNSVESMWAVLKRGLYGIRSVAIFRAPRKGVRPISGANNGAPAIAFGGLRSSRRALRAAPGLPQ